MVNRFVVGLTICEWAAPTLSSSVRRVVCVIRNALVISVTLNWPSHCLTLVCLTSHWLYWSVCVRNVVRCSLTLMTRMNWKKLPTWKVWVDYEWWLDCLVCCVELEPVPRHLMWSTAVVHDSLVSVDSWASTQVCKSRPLCKIRIWSETPMWFVRSFTEYQMPMHGSWGLTQRGAIHGIWFSPCYQCHLRRFVRPSHLAQPSPMTNSHTRLCPSWSVTCCFAKIKSLMWRQR